MQAYTLTRERNRVFSRVFAGLFASLAMATIGVYTGQFVPPGVLTILMLVEFGMIIAAMFLQRRRSIGMVFVLAFTFISGMTLFPVIASYAVTLGAGTVVKALVVSAGAFLIASIVASSTSFDFSFLGGFLLIGLFAILLFGLISLFVGFNTMTGLIYSLLGIAIFIGYVLFDVNRMAHHGLSTEMVPWMVLSLYLDFVNLFLFVLRLLGILQTNRR